MTSVPVQEPSLSRLALRDELGRTLKHCAAKTHVANLKVWIVGLLLVVVLSVVGTVGLRWRHCRLDGSRHRTLTRARDTGCRFGRIAGFLEDLQAGLPQVANAVSNLWEPRLQAERGMSA